MSAKNVAVLISGCGFYDGAEITEAVSTLIALSKAGASYQCFSLDKEQMHTIDHIKGAESEPNRNLLTESARIARGEVLDLSEADLNDFDAVILPGGFGVAKNFCNFATAGADMTVDGQVEDFLNAAQAAGKPIGLICIAPVLGAKLFSAKVTIGSDPGTAEAIAAMGGKNEEREVTDIAIDEDRKVISAPAYMCDASPFEVYTGIEKLVAATLARA